MIPGLVYHLFSLLAVRSVYTVWYIMIERILREEGRRHISTSTRGRTSSRRCVVAVSIMDLYSWKEKQGRMFIYYRHVHSIVSYLLWKPGRTWLCHTALHIWVSPYLGKADTELHIWTWHWSKFNNGSSKKCIAYTQMTDVHIWAWLEMSWHVRELRSHPRPRVLLVLPTCKVCDGQFFQISVSVQG